MKAIVDCNSFYCSCERLFRPDLATRPVVVLSNNDGCIVSRTDEAKAAGIAMAVPFYQNRELIEKNQVAVFSSNYGLYGDLSMRVMDTLRQLAGSRAVEVYSVDEAFLDLSHIPPGRLDALAIEIRDTVETWTGIRVSIGIAPTKVLAKLANRLAKKDKAATGCILTLDSPDLISRSLQNTPVGDVWGVGYRSAKKLREVWSISDAWQLSRMSEEWARMHLGGVVGVRLLRELNGEACIELKDPLENKKMIATTRMFGRPVHRLCDLKEAVATYTSRAAEKLRRQYCAAGMVDVFLVNNEQTAGSYNYQPRMTRHHTSLLRATSDTSELIRAALPLVEQLFHEGTKYLKAGVMLGDLVPDEAIQADMFQTDHHNRGRMLMETVDNINFSMRDDAVKYVASGLKRNWKMRQEMRSRRFTTRWDELFTVS